MISTLISIFVIIGIFCTCGVCVILVAITLEWLKQRRLERLAANYKEPNIYDAHQKRK